MAQNNYTEEDIRTLKGLEAIRVRPGMYIGRLGDGKDPGDGIYVLLKEIVDNAVDEFAMGCGKEIRVNITDGKKVSVRDFGRGIPLDKVIDVVTIPHTGAKFDDKIFKKSIGLNGVGAKAVNALSSQFEVCSYRDGVCSRAMFERGELTESAKEETHEKNGTLITFTPDSVMFGDFAYDAGFVESMIKNYSYLKKGLCLTLNGVSYKSENGLLDLVNDSLTEETLYPPIHLEGQDIEVVLGHCNAYGENISSFVNGQNTRDGGTHLAAYREAIAKTLKNFFKKNYEAADCRQGIIGAISIQIQEPNFEGQTKTKLGSNYMWEKQIKDENGNVSMDIGPTIRTYVNDFISKNLNNYLHMHKDIVPVIEEKIRSSKQEREEISGIQKKTRERNKRASVYNPKLRDCRFHYNDKVNDKNREFVETSSIFITEGDSASGTITQARNPNYQAVFSLRGKSLNSYKYKESRKKVAENVEFNLLISALGIEDDTENLRYNNIIIATDADDDGMHIRMLVLTFFMQYYPDLIRKGHIYILQTPLFRVRNKKSNRYCYSPEEKDKAVTELKTGVEITRFKGLGEISSHEFVHFIGPEIRLDPVKLAEEESLSNILEFYMGDNTPERQNFVLKNLRSEEELEDINI